jgi:inosine-uridine nucleoside N-ribohydrolase
VIILGQVTVLALGPLTNIAIALHLYPNFVRNLYELVVLGGSYQGAIFFFTSQFSC